MWPLLGKIALSLAPTVVGWFLGKQKEPAVTQNAYGSYQPYFDQYLKSMMGILQGNMPEAVTKMEDRLKKQIEAEAGSVLNRAIGSMMSRGVVRSGLSNMVGRDVSTMAANELANRLAQLEYGIYGQALAGIPAVLGQARQGEWQAYQQRLAGQQAMWQSLGNLATIGTRILDYFFNSNKKNTGGTNGTSGRVS